MLLSMTGFGKASVEASGRKITVEIKSLNSKQLDISTRIPAMFRDKDPEIRARIGAVLERGKVDLNIYVENTGADEGYRLNIGMLADYKHQIEQMGAELSLPAPEDWYAVLLRMPDIFRNDAPSATDPSLYAALVSALDNALQALTDYRRIEGQRLEEFFRPRVDGISRLLDSVEPYEQERVAKIRSRIADNLAKLPVAEYDHGRLEQEMIYYIEKLDVNEEKQRLRQHLNYFIETMDSPRPGQGKQLGFIAQEMGREINTLGSKSNHADMQRIVVQMKDELEQIKEQVLNVM